MAKVKGPLFSFAASGNTTGGSMQFRTTKAGTHVYQPPDPSKQNQTPPSPQQEAQRLKFKEACNEWALMSFDQRADYAERGAKLDLTGFSMFMREKMTQSEA